MGIRRQLGYPPYYFTIGITLSHKKEEEVVKRAYEVMSVLRSGLSETSNILGPTPKAYCSYPQPLSLPDFN